MTEHTFPVAELPQRPLPKTAEGQLVIENGVNNLSRETIPEEPSETELHPKWKNAKMEVIGPRYGDITVKIVTDGGRTERLKFRIIDEQRNEVAAKTNPQEIPQIANVALLKAGWFCTDWGDLYTAPSADYLITYGAICRHFDQTEKYDDCADDVDTPPDIKTPLLDGYNPEKLANVLYDAAMEIYYSKLIKKKICHEDLRKELEQRMAGDSEIEAPTGAIQATIKDLGGGIDPRGKVGERKPITLQSNGNEENQPSDEMVYDQLLHNTNLTDVPNSCIHYLPEFGPTTPGPDLWSNGLPASGYFHFPYQDITERYDVYTQTVNDNGSEFLQVGVATSQFSFYEQFKKISEDKYQTVNTNGSLPAIYCAAVLRNKGYEIVNLPTATNPTLEDLYQTAAETVVKIFKANDKLHEGAIRRLSTVGSIIESQAISASSEGRTIPQEDLPEQATANLPKQTTAEGYHKTIKQEDILNGLIGKLPDDLDDINEAASH